jgi:hypothetical protein
MTISQNLLQTAFSIYCKNKTVLSNRTFFPMKEGKHFSLFFPLSFPDTSTNFMMKSGLRSVKTIGKFVAR